MGVFIPGGSELNATATKFYFPPYSGKTVCLLSLYWFIFSNAVCVLFKTDAAAAAIIIVKSAAVQSAALEEQRNCDESTKTVPKVNK